MNFSLRSFFLTLMLLFVGISLHAQTPSAIEFVELNNIRTRIAADGTFFQDKGNSAADFEVPVNSGSHAIFHSSFCFSAKSSGTVYSAGNSFGTTDFLAGPLTVDSGTTSPTIRNDFDEIWVVSRGAINTHKTDYNLPTYTVPTSIRDWPAHGDTTKGYDYYLAPFFDNDSNGTYEPDSGDYPLIKGDEAFFFILNDANFHAQTAGPAIGIEVHCMVYGFATNNALNDAIFVDYTLINRSKRDYEDCYVGKFTDFDLGNPLDDFLETDVNRSMVFAKNGDSFDEDAFGLTGYKDELAAIGLVTLKGPLVDKDSLDNDCDTANSGYAVNGLGFADGIVDNERLGMSNCIPMETSGVIYSGEFDRDSTLFQYMRSIWRDGRPLTHGGNGHRTTGGTSVRMPYFADTDSLRYGSYGDSVATTWTEDDALNIPGDRRVVCSSGPFTLKSGERQEVSYAYVYARASVLNSISNSVEVLKEQVDTVINDFRKREQITQCLDTISITSIKESEIKAPHFKAYPNPNQGQFMLQLNAPSTVRIINLLGKTVLEKKLKEGRNTLELPVSLGNGLYILQINSGDEKWNSQKILLNQ